MALAHTPLKKPLSLREMQTWVRKFVADWQGETRENAEAPQDLVAAHKNLDRAVDSIFGFRKSPTRL